MTLGPRPDLIDRMVELWLSYAVGIAAAATGWLEPYRAPWPEEPAPAADAERP